MPDAAPLRPVLAFFVPLRIRPAASVGKLLLSVERGGLPPSSARIVSPYDLTARYARRGATRWTGFLAHVTETCGDGTVNITTDVATVSATAHDTRELAATHRRLEQQSMLPSRHLVDGGYTSVQLRQAAHPRALRRGYVHRAPVWAKIQAEARAERKTAGWKSSYAPRSGVESTMSEFVQGHGMRQTRYRDQGKAHVQHVLTAIAVNVERINALTADDQPPEPRAPTSLQQYLDMRQVPRPRSCRTP